jgi:hypothetical protein
MDEDVIDLRPLLAEADTRTKLKSTDVGDWIFPTDNDFSIPLLSKDLQPRGLELPTNRWGARARRDRIEGGTFHFYTDDYRFEALWKSPAPVVNSGAHAVAETNFSTNDEMPLAVFLWHLYRKRWLSRYWQSYNVEIWADLAVAPRYRQYALLGVPAGWRAYATYSFGSHGIDKVIAEAELAYKPRRDRRDPPLGGLWRGVGPRSLPGSRLDRDTEPSAGLSSQRRREKGNSTRRGDHIPA